MTELPATRLSATGQTLEGVEAQPRGDPPADASYLIARCSIGAATLVPLAPRVLADDPLAEGDFYPGDLLAAVLHLDHAYWIAHPEERAELAVIASKVRSASAGRTPLLRALPQMSFPSSSCRRLVRRQRP